MPRTVRPAGARTLIAAADRPQWWLEQAQQLSPRIPDAPTPTVVRSHPGEDIYVAARGRGPRKVTAIMVSKPDLAPLAGTTAGKWAVAAALARGRWPRRAGHPGKVGPTMLLLAAFMSALVAVSAATTLLTVVWACTAVLGAAGCALWLWLQRRRAVLVAWSGDDQATRLAGLDAARAVLGVNDGDGLYRTAAHAWWAGKDQLSPGNRLARLERRATENR